MKRIPLSEAKNDLSGVIDTAERQHEPVVITRHGKPAAILYPIGDEDDWLDYRLRHDPKLRARLEQSARELAAGKGVRLEDLPSDFWTRPPEK